MQPWWGGWMSDQERSKAPASNLIQARFKRAGMQWKSQGFLNVIELRVARRSPTDEGFWKNHGIPVREAAGRRSDLQIEGTPDQVSPGGKQIPEL